MPCGVRLVAPAHRNNAGAGTCSEAPPWWDVPTFRGSAWASHEGTILLRLERKDEPGAHFVELIVLAGDGATRARTWHWFRDGRLYRRTLCDETRDAPPGPALPPAGATR